jgi:hypothetical protein
MSVVSAAYIGAAVIAASGAFVGMVLGKEQKTTEFRQAWINDQRTDLATMFSLSESADLLADESRLEALHAFDAAHNRVRLRENPVTPEWHYVLEELKTLRAAVARDGNSASVPIARDRAVDLSQKLLKTEWTRVRRGEQPYPFLKVAIPVLVLIVGSALAYGKGFITLGG